MGPFGSDQSRHVDDFGAKNHNFDDFDAKKASFGRLFDEKRGYGHLFIDGRIYLEIGRHMHRGGNERER